MTVNMPPTQSITVADALRDLAQLLPQVSRRETHVVVHQDGDPIAVIISPGEFERLSRLDRDLTSAATAPDDQPSALANECPVGGAVAARPFVDSDVADERRRRALEVLRQSWAVFADVPTDELDRELAKARVDVRAEMRDELRALLASNA